MARNTLKPFAPNAKLVLGAILALAIVLGLSVQSVTAYTYLNKKITGYAFGRYLGAANRPMQQGNFANHPPGYCGDPAGNWAWDTSISFPYNSITMHDYNGNSFQKWTFTLTDNGDAGCTQPTYWVDIFFGSYKRSWETCDTSCAGVPDPYCVNVPYQNCNSCTDARNFGVNWWTYTGP